MRREVVPLKWSKHGVLSFGCFLRKKRLPLNKFVSRIFFHAVFFGFSMSSRSISQSQWPRRGNLWLAARAHWKRCRNFADPVAFRSKKVVPFDDPLSLSKKRTVRMVRNKSNTTYCWIRLAQAQIDQLLGNGTTSFSMLSSHHPTPPNLHKMEK